MSDFSRLDDRFPRLGGEEAQLKHRGRVLRMALYYGFWTALLVALVAVAVYNIASGDSGFVIMLIVGLVFGLLTGHQAAQFLRDLAAKPVVHEGDVLRKWNKGNLFLLFFPSYYIMVERRVFTITREEYALLLEDDLVRVTCYPHSLTIERLERYDTTEKQFVPATSGASV